MLALACCAVPPPAKERSGGGSAERGGQRALVRNLGEAVHPRVLRSFVCKMPADEGGVNCEHKTLCGEVLLNHKCSLFTVSLLEIIFATSSSEMPGRLR